MMNIFFKKLILSSMIMLSLFATTSCLAGKKYIALTIDDLPFVGEGKSHHLGLIIDVLKVNEIPATGFVIAGHIAPNDWAILEKFHDKGFEVGNHTLTHANLNTMQAMNYIKEIDSADKILSPILTRPKFFRYPYLAMGRGKKKEQVVEHLSNKNYRIAPITIDSKDFIFNQLLLSVPEKQRRDFFEALKPCYINFLKQQTLKAEEASSLPQILLIHANLLNAYALQDIINFYEENGYTFVNLEVALDREG